MIHGVEGIGKTSAACHAPGAVVMMARGETGLETLIDSGQLPEVPHFAEIHTWSTVMTCLEYLRSEPHEHKTVVLDALNGFERLCHEEVCRRDFNGNWGKKGFANYQEGYDVALADWRMFLGKLDELREQRHMAVILIGHTKVGEFRNPEGSDYDRYTVDLHKKTWAMTSKWADIILFANYFTVVKEDGPRSKAYGGTQRFFYTQRTASWDAKNRHGLPEQISMGGSGKEAWDNFVTELKAAKARS